MLSVKIITAFPEMFPGVLGYSVIGNALNEKKWFLETINLHNFGAGDLINIKKTNNQSFYIPMNEDNIVRIDTKKKLVIVSPIKGILD